MPDDMFTFIDPIFDPIIDPIIDLDMFGDDEFQSFGKIELLFESPEQFIADYESVDAALSSKVKEIIETQWGKNMADLQDLYVGQFHERIEEGGDNVSYRPTNRYVLRAKFPHARDPRRIIFTLAA
ncbi:MAG TPA: hypothetical protein VKY19_14090 [Ktedonosporobacter sp.]|jgi:hypothetical protein|nr:hypothetical protein [Ktedonosporobacter sp.]